ncbi:hypothetical protein [Paenibacillus lautus]|uniref:hypothetical protein n=1 Tax=Paenibacillus lautus TaxID=1401 RepID=UPI001C7C9F25|nr:hypothetical protein [Paenibacillus lautus]MBX4152236.1 hypothetical protein [Paenibacillus lautus]
MNINNHNHGIPSNQTITWKPVINSNETVLSHRAATEMLSSLSDVGGIIRSYGKNNKGDNYMENLYQVTVVSKTREIIIDTTSIVAVDQENAKYLVGLYETLSERRLTPADVTVVINHLGQVKIDEQK